MSLATYETIVLLSGIGMLMILVVWGKSIFVVAPLCALLVVTLSGIDPLTAMTGPYMNGFSDYIRRFYLIFALGAVFGKLMDDSGAAIVIANSIGRWAGTKRACLAVVLACAVLTYGGVSLFVVGFSVYPLAVHLFRAANLPRRFIPSAIAFGSATFTMTSAGSPEIQNLIPIQYLVDHVTKQPLTDARAGWPVSFIVAVLMFVLGQGYLEWAIHRETKLGKRWEHRHGDREPEPDDVSTLPRPWQAFVPLIVTLAALNLLPWLFSQIATAWTVSAEEGSSFMGRIHGLLRHFPEDPTLSIFLGVASALIVLRRHLDDCWKGMGDGFINGLVAIGSTAAVVGFGLAVKDLPAFKRIVDGMTSMECDPLIGAALAVAVIAGITGSASGGQGIALPILKPIYIDQLGVAPRALHRVIAISSGSLDSLPANGYLVMLVRAICGETHARAYGPIFVTTVLVPAIGTIVAIGLFKLVPGWQLM